MKQTLLIAGAALIALTAGPAFAKPGHGHGNGQGSRQDQGYEREDDRDRGDYGDRDGGRNCPPGLAKKHNGCQPPGQARKFHRGDRYVSGYGTPYGYRSLPYDVRQQYNLDPNDRYYYNKGTLYGVDARTGLIEQVLSLILR